MSKLINAFLFWVTETWRVWVIHVDTKPYLERYKFANEWKWFERLRQKYEIKYYLHHFVSEDSEEWLHDHPWEWAICIVLSGGYVEERLTAFCPWYGLVTEERNVNWFNRLTKSTVHKVLKVKPNTWTLIITGPDVKVEGKPKSWGFVEDTQIDKRGFAFFYTQPFVGERTQDFMPQMPTGKEYREQQLEEQRQSCGGYRVGEKHP